jgi:hypothetical protein
MIPAFQRVAAFAALQAARDGATVGSLVRCLGTENTKRLNLCNAVNDALHIAMETNDR